MDQEEQEPSRKRQKQDDQAEETVTVFLVAPYFEFYVVRPKFPAHEFEMRQKLQLPMRIAIFDFFSRCILWRFHNTCLSSRPSAVVSMFLKCASRKEMLLF